MGVDVKNFNIKTVTALYSLVTVILSRREHDHGGMRDRFTRWIPPRREL